MPGAGRQSGIWAIIIPVSSWHLSTQCYWLCIHFYWMNRIQFLCALALLFSWHYFPEASRYSMSSLPESARGEGTTDKKPGLETCLRKKGGGGAYLLISGWCHRIEEVCPKKERFRGWANAINLSPYYFFPPTNPSHSLSRYYLLTVSGLFCFIALKICWSNITIRAILLYLYSFRKMVTPNGSKRTLPSETF